MELPIQNCEEESDWQILSQGTLVQFKVPNQATLVNRSGQAMYLSFTWGLTWFRVLVYDADLSNSPSYFVGRATLRKRIMNGICEGELVVHAASKAKATHRVVPHRHKNGYQKFPDDQVWELGDNLVAFRRIGATL